MSEQPPNLPPPEGQNIPELQDETEVPEPETAPESNKQKSENSWLNPERILELKEKYERLLASEKEHREKVQPDLFVSDHYKNILKTHVIESAAANAKAHAEYAQEHHGLGQVPKELSEDTKRQMAKLMDMPYEELEKRAGELPEFRSGQRVRIMRGGEPEEGWQIENAHHRHGIKVVKKRQRGEEVSFISKEALLEHQQQASRAEIDETLEAIKPYFDKEAKVKVGEEFVKGIVRGLSMKKDKEGNPQIYVDYVVGDEEKKAQLFSLDKFLQWQKESQKQDEEEAYQIEEQRQEEAEKEAESEEAADGAPEQEAQKGEGQSTEEITETEDDEERLLSWWEKTKERHYKRPPSQRVAIDFLGLLALATGPGLAAGSVAWAQHKLHHFRLNREAEKKEEEVKHRQEEIEAAQETESEMREAA